MVKATVSRLIFLKNHSGGDDDSIAVYLHTDCGDDVAQCVALTLVSMQSQVTVMVTTQPKVWHRCFILMPSQASSHDAA